MWAKAERYADLRIVDKNEAGKINGFQFDVLTTPEGRGYIYISLSLSISEWTYRCVYSVNCAMRVAVWIDVCYLCSDAALQKFASGGVRGALPRLPTPLPEAILPLHGCPLHRVGQGEVRATELPTYF
jgi:hypothetical protein